MLSDRIVSINFTASGVRCPNSSNDPDTSNGGPSVEDWKRASTSPTTESPHAGKTCSVITRLQRKLTSGSSKSHIRHATFSTHRRRRSSRCLLSPTTPRATHARSFASCPCPCPSCCGSLPPPSNQPPRCIQCMTGYYYYPYGFWFCGPYHVTGQCCPVGPGGICGSKCPCPPTPACVCPTTAAVLPSMDQSPKAMSEQPVESPASMATLQSSKTSISETGARKAGRPSLSNFFPFPADTKQECRPKSGATRKARPTLQSSFFCVPYKFKSPLDDPMDASTGSDRTKSPISKQNLNLRVDNTRHHSHVASRRPKRCKYMGYINPLTLPKDGSDHVGKLNKLMADSKLK